MNNNVLKLNLKNNLNNLNLFWQALGSQAKGEYFVHARWPNKCWRADFMLTNLSAEWVNQVIATIDENVQHWPAYQDAIQLTVMSLNLAEFNHHWLPTETNRQVIQLTNSTRISEWVAVCSEAFAYQVDAEVIIELTKHKNATLFAYMADDSIAATAVAFQTENTLGIHQLGTHPNFQGQGIARKLMFALIDHARKIDCQEVSLQASQAGLALYQQLGFKPLAKLTNIISDKLSS